MAVRITRAGVALTVGIILLTGLIIGGLLWAKQAGEQARREEAVKIAEQNLEEQSRDDVAKDTDEEATSESTEHGEHNTSHETPQTTPQTGNSNVGSLPETGANDVAALLAVALMTYAGVLYARSRSVRALR